MWIRDFENGLSEEKKTLPLSRIGRGRNRRLVTSSGIVKEVDSKGYVKTDTCPNHFRKVVEICIRRSTSMISNNTQSSSEYSNSQYY